MRVVLDSNVLLSALISPHGAPHRVYEAWRERRFDLVTCPTQLDEIRRASKGGLSRFVEDAVRARILEVEAEAAKGANAGRGEAEIAGAVGEALEWARHRR